MTETDVLHVAGQAVPRSQVRYRFTDQVLVCGEHRLAAEEDQLRDAGGYMCTPQPDGECSYCAEGRPVQEHRTDAFGNPICGQDFMAGTICTAPPDHDGYHAPLCQNCGGDWYDETCTCP